MVLLISPKTTKPSELNLDFFREPNTGLLYLAAILDLHDIFVEILDLEQYSHLDPYEIKSILHKKSVNHNIFGITSLTNTFYDAISIAATVKKINPNNITIFGGPHVSFLFKKILNEYNKKENLIDFICIGEAEESFLELVKIIQKHYTNNTKDISSYEVKINSIEGLAYINSKEKVQFTDKPSDIIDLKKLPLPARFKLTNINYYYSAVSYTHLTLPTTPYV